MEFFFNSVESVPITGHPCTYYICNANSCCLIMEFHYYFSKKVFINKFNSIVLQHFTAYVAKFYGGCKICYTCSSHHPAGAKQPLYNYYFCDCEYCSPYWGSILHHMPRSLCQIRYTGHRYTPLVSAFVSWLRFRLHRSLGSCSTDPTDPIHSQLRQKVTISAICCSYIQL